MTQKGNPKKSKNIKSKSTSKRVDFHVEGNITESIVVVGDNNVIKYYSTIAKNIEKHEPDYWNLKHPYPMPPNFTGRIAERAMLTQWLNDDSKNHLFILRALGGFGKSALTWHWLTHDVNHEEWAKVVFWSFYEGDASFEHFIEETLKYLKLEVPQGQRLQLDELLKAMQSQKTLLIMDGFERALRAYSSMNAAYQGDEEPKMEDNQLDCVNINAEIFLKSICSLPSMKSKVLMTTRLTPRVVKPRGEFMLGCREEELTAMQKDDAIEFFHKQKIKGTHAEIEAACAPYGYHPLSLRILAGLIANDREIPGDIAVASKLDITDDVIANKHHVLEVSFNTLSSEQQKLLSNLACFRSPMKYAALKVISGIPARIRKKAKTSSTEKLNDSLQILENRGLLQWDRKVNTYDLHPIVRRYAYERLTTSERITAHTRLRDYFAAVDVPKPQTLDDLGPVIELYLHTVQAGEFDKALEIYQDRLWKIIFYQLGSCQTQIDLLSVLFVDGEDKPPRLTEGRDQGFAMHELADAYGLVGQPLRAIPLFEGSNKISEKLESRENFAISLSAVAHVAYLPIGALNSAKINYLRQINISEKIPDEFLAASGHQELGYLFSYLGMWEESKHEFEVSLGISEKLGEIQDQGLTWAYRAHHTLLAMREFGRREILKPELGISLAQRAIELAEETERRFYPLERDIVRAYWLLGAAYRLDDQLDFAERYLIEALTRDRAINLIQGEANILLDLARLRYDQMNYEEAKSLAEEALYITERCGYVLQGADVNLFLAQYTLEHEKDRVKAKEYTESALKLAYCDGPPYYYKVAYEEAERMIAKMKDEG